MLDWLPSLGSIGSVFSTLWAWKGVILVGLVVMGFLMAYGFLKPFVDAILGTYNRVILPLLEIIVKSKYGLAIVFAVAFIGWTIGAYMLGDHRAEERCDATIARRERDAIAKERDELARALDAVERLGINDRKRAADDEAERQKRKSNADAFRKNTGPCFDIPTARRLFGR